MKTRILLSLFIAFNFCTAAAQVVNIPDNNFKQALLNISPSIDLNNDGQIQVSEALAVTAGIMVSNKNIQDLTGIEAFKNITLLDCSWNQVSTLQLSGLNKLYYLDCFRNNISSLQLSSLPALRSLDCSNNQMTNLQLTGTDLPVMDVFRCTDNPLLTNADLHGMPSLDWCEITGNPMLKKLNVSNSPLITKLLAQANNLDSINISGCVAITNLILDQNSLDTLDLHSQGLLEFLTCMQNPLKSIDLSKQVNLGSLVCSENPIKSIDISKCTKLTSLTCGETANTLEYLNLKNGLPGLSLWGIINPFGLKYVCANEEDVLPFINYFAQQGIFNINVNPYCSFTPGGNYNSIKGKFRFDSNGNGCDNNDVLLNDVKMNLSHSGQNLNTFTNNTGNYIFYAQTGSYTVKPVLQNPYFTVTPDSATFSFAATNGTVKTQDFCAVKNGIHNDLEISLVPQGAANAGLNSTYKLIIRNKGTEILSGTASLGFDDYRMDFLSASINPNNQSTGSLSWNYSALDPFETRVIDIDFSVAAPPVNYASDTLVFQAVIDPVTGDETPTDNSFDLRQSIDGPSAPVMNINCMEGPALPLAKIGDYIHYRIGFQNTGTDTVINIVVKDILDTKLNWSSMQVTSASHSCVVKQSQGKTVEFIFEKIKLPAKQQNPAASSGYISFKIKTNSNLLPNDSVLNAASVYFDNKPPVATNTSKVKFFNNTFPLVNLGADINQCGGAVTLNAGNSGAAYLWNTGATTQTIMVNVTGTYWVKVTNTLGNSASDTVSINFKPVPVVNLGADISQCGGTATLDAGNQGAAYVWNTNATSASINVATSGNYWVKVTNSAGCSRSDSILIDIKTLPVLNFSLPDTISASSAAIDLIATPAGGSFSGSGVINDKFYPATVTPGIVRISYNFTAPNGCSNIRSEDIYVQGSLHTIAVYPNPSKGNFTVFLPDPVSDGMIWIVSPSGAVVGKYDINGSSRQINTSLQAGIYYLKITGNNFKSIQKLLIRP